MKQLDVDVSPSPIERDLMFIYGLLVSLRKKVEPKQLHPWSRFMVRNSAPPLALFWCHLQMWSCFCLKKGPKQLHPGWWSRFGSNGGAVLAAKKLEMIIKGKTAPPSQVAPFSKNGSRVEQFRLHFFSQWYLGKHVKVRRNIFGECILY